MNDGGKDGATTERPLGRERNIILVVDDSPDALRMLTEAVEQSGATVLVALEGEAALKIAAQITPDVILMDAVMPGMDGFETTRRLKADPALSHVPVIFMTGLSETEHILKGLQAGGVDYVTKPLVTEELLARIRVHLANARAAQNARAALDTAGRFLLAVDGGGGVLWCTPQARRLIDAALPPEGGREVLGERLRGHLRDNPLRGGSAAAIAFPSAGEARIRLSFLGTIGDDEHLFRLTGEDGADEEALVARRFGLTKREAEVLLWISKGKSNRDIGEILSLSPRTISKHLESIFEKIGVESRSAAAFKALQFMRDDSNPI